MSEKQTDRVNLTVGRWESLWYRAWAGLSRLKGVNALRTSPIVRAMCWELRGAHVVMYLPFSEANLHDWFIKYLIYEHIYSDRLYLTYLSDVGG